MSDADGVSDPLAITVAGRTFRPATPYTMAQHAYFDLQVRKAGVIVPAADGDEFEAVVSQLIETDRMQYVLAAEYVEDGKKWNREAADKLAAWFWERSDPADIEALRVAIYVVLLRFFPQGMLSSGISPMSGDESVPQQQADTPTSDSPATDTPEASTTSESGDSLPDESPDSTTTG